MNCWPLNGFDWIPQIERVDQVVTVEGGERRSYTRSHLFAIAAARSGEVSDAEEPAGEVRKAAEVMTSEEPNETSGSGSCGEGEGEVDDRLDRRAGD